MKTRLLVALGLLVMSVLNAQEQPGVVKTIGRPGQPGNPLDSVLVRAKGAVNASVSDNEGSFTIVLDRCQTGQAYSLSRVSRNGYQLADGNVIGRAYPFSSEIPLEIAMVSTDDYNRVKIEIETRVRNAVEQEYQAQISDIRKRLEEKTISEEAYQQKMVEILDYYDNSSNLIKKLADRYARMDYDRLDSIDIRINALIEQGKLEEAEALINSKGTKQALEEVRKNNLLMEKTLAEGRKVEAKMVSDYASELLMKFDIASLRFANEEAAGYLKERMQLDTTMVDWGIDYANFIRDYLGRYDEAMAIYEKALEQTEDIFEKAEIYGCIGHLHEIRGNYDSAMEAFVAGVELKESLSTKTASLATSYHNIASVHLTMNNYDEVVPYLQKAQEIYKENGDSLGITFVTSAMAVVCDDQGNFEEAEKNLLKTLEIRERILGENSLDVATTCANLATFMQNLGRYDEAMKYSDRALGIRTKVLGKHHPDVAMSYLDMGSLEGELGNNNENLRYYEEALRILKDFHGEVHPSIAIAYNRIGYYYNNVMNDSQKALHYYIESMEMLKHVYGEEHSHVAKSIHNLASAYYSIADYDKAMELYNQALELRIRLFGEDHVSLADTYNNIGHLYSMLGNYKDALAYSQKVLDIYTEFYGEQNHRVALAYNNIGAIYENLDEDQTALDYLGKSCEIYQAYGESYPGLADPYDLIGTIYLKHSMYDQAENFLKEGMRIREEAYGKDNISVANSLNNLSQLYLDKKDYALAEETLLRAVEIIKSHGRDKYPEAATILSNLGVVYYRQKNYAKALEYYLPSLEIVERYMPEKHDKRTNCRYAVADAYYRYNDFENALFYIKPLFHDVLEQAGTEDKFTVHCFNFMNELYVSIMGAEDYDGHLDDEFAAFNENVALIATVGENSLASQMGLNGTYYVVAFEEWTLGQFEKNFFLYNMSQASKQSKTYVFYREGEFTIVPFEGRLGVRLNPQWISAEENLQMVKKYKKWARKNR